MLILKVPAAIAAVLFMSVSAQAMEFANRPGPISEAFNSPSSVSVTRGEDRLRRQINNHLELLPTRVAGRKLADQPNPVSLIQIRVGRMIFKDRPGRLSAEFSAVARDSGIRFEYGPGEISAWLKPTATRIAMKFDHRPGPISNLFPTSAAVNIKFADRHGFTSSLTKTTPLSEIPPRQGTGGSCVGSMAPCGSLSFADHSRMGILSAAYNDERL